MTSKSSPNPRNKRSLSFSQKLMTETKSSSSPTHLGIIMDGNRRWAKQKGIRTLEGHSRGYENLKDLAIYALVTRKIPVVSGFVFSTENWSRTKEEVSYLMGLIKKGLNQYLEEFHQNNIRIVVSGSRDRLSKSVLASIRKAENKTISNTGGMLVMCFNYGGQQEIVDATKKIIGSGLGPEELDVDSFAQNLYHPDIPPVDLIIRTSGEQRLSGFMLWRAAYSELYFADKHWPDFDAGDIDSALEAYAKRQRRYGR